MTTMILPTIYVEIEQEEMMYLDGGVYCVNEGWGSWYVHFTKSDCGTISAITGGIAFISGRVSSMLTKGGAATYGAIAKITQGVLALVSGLFLYAYYNNGLRVYFKAYVIPNWFKVIK